MRAASSVAIFPCALRKPDAALTRAVTLVKKRRKVVCGSQEGVLSIFDYNDIQDISDRFPGHPSSVDAVLAVDEDIVLTGSSDGLIRIISVLPNKMLGACELLALSWPSSHSRVANRRCGRALRLARGASGVLRGRHAAR